MTNPYILQIGIKRSGEDQVNYTSYINACIKFGYGYFTNNFLLEKFDSLEMSWP